MAKLSAFRTDVRAINDGIWITVDERLFDDLQIQTRGFTDEFLDAQAARIQAAADRHEGDRARIPNAEMRRINAGLVREFLVLGVRNLQHDDERPVTLDEFLAMLDRAEYARLHQACWKAAGKVTTRTAAQLETAAGN